MNRTYFPTDEDVDRKWYLVDARDEVLGRISSFIAKIITGKHKPNYTPSVDTGDFVIVINAGKVRLTGDKYEDKMYQNYSGFPGGLKEVSAGELLEEDPEKVVSLSVKGMLPKSKLGDKMFKKVKVYAGEEHPHEAQQPVEIRIDDFK